MVRLVALFCAVSTECFGQAVTDVDRQLATGEPRDIAWAAYTIGVQKRFDRIPKLVELVGSYEDGAGVDQGRVSPAAAAIEAVADALIRLDARLPADVAMHLYPRFPAQTIILLSRATDNTGPLREIFRNTKSRDLWLAAGNLLATHPPPGFVRALLGGAVTTFSFHVVWAKTDEGRGFGGGCAGDSLMTPDENFKDWPRARMYRIVHSERAQSVFAPGIHPVGFSWWDTTDYWDPWQDGGCSEETSRYWRTGLLAQLLGKDLHNFPLQPEVNETVLFTSPADFEDTVRSAIEQKSRALGEVVRAFVKSGKLTLEESAEVELRCKIAVVDERPLPRADLPKVVGRWCAAPPSDADPRMP